MRHSSPRSSSDRLVATASRSVITKTDDTKLFQTAGLDVQSGEKHQDVEHLTPYGFTSNVQPPTEGAAGSNTAAEAFIVYMASDRTHPVALVSGDRRYRLMQLKPGETALHDDQGQQIHLTRKGIVQTALNSQAHTHNIMPDKSSALNKDQGGGAGATDKNGQMPWQTLIDDGKQAPFAYHSIDKTARTTSHPGTVVHNIWDKNDAKDPKIAASKKKVIHSHTLDQDKGSILSIAKGKHKRVTDPTTGIKDSVENDAHSITLDTSGVTTKSAASILQQAATAITHTAPNINHEGNTNISQNLNVSGMSALMKGLSTGALEVAADEDGGLAQATMGLKILLGLTTDTMNFSAPPIQAVNDSAAILAGVPLYGVYRNGSVLMVRVTSDLTDNSGHLLIDSSGSPLLVLL
jgi:phage gp45-like